MPTPTGLPKVGEVWELRVAIPGREVIPQRVVVTDRSGGEYWSMRVWHPTRGRELWVDAPYHLRVGWLKYLCPAGNETRKKLGLPPMKRKQEMELARYRTEQARKEQA